MKKIIKAWCVYQSEHQRPAINNKIEGMPMVIFRTKKDATYYKKMCMHESKVITCEIKINL